jgi:hypothetical protein
VSLVFTKEQPNESDNTLVSGHESGQTTQRAPAATACQATRLGNARLV